MMHSITGSNLQALLHAVLDTSTTEQLFERLEIPVSTIQPAADRVTRLELAQALNMALFQQLLGHVPSGRAYVEDAAAAGIRICFDHGAVRTVLRQQAGDFPNGEAFFTRLLLPLGYQRNGVYPLPRLQMTGRVYTHLDDPENIAQFFVSELHPEHFSAPFQSVVEEVLASAVDPLSAAMQQLLTQLASTGTLPFAAASQLLPAMLNCFARHHRLPTQTQYQQLLAESAEMAWIATEGSVFNHATDRVKDVEETAAQQRALGRPIKDLVEVSRNGRVRQTAFRADKVSYQLSDQHGQLTPVVVPGSFYEFISRDSYTDPVSGVSKLDLSFDSGNAQGIFKMTAGDSREASVC